MRRLLIWLLCEQLEVHKWEEGRGRDESKLVCARCGVWVMPGGFDEGRIRKHGINRVYQIRQRPPPPPPQRPGGGYQPAESSSTRVPPRCGSGVFDPGSRRPR